jgi:hypothetical protein
MVPGTGIEPVRLAARDFESRASTYSAIPATRAALSLICHGRATVAPGSGARVACVQEHGSSV